jgi:Flp pilus assembly protein TadG
MILKPLLSRDNKGIGAVEFALVAPVLIAFIVGVSQLGRMFYANADMKNAIAHGARVASVYSETEISDATIIAAVNNRLMREGANTKATTTVFRGTENGNPFVELRVTYSVPLEFIFFNTPPVTLKDTRKVFTQVVLANQTTITTTSASSSTSATSAGGTTSSTSASSTSASSTSSGDASTSTSSTTSSGSTGNGSSGSNNGSSGHAHGDCKNQC